MILDLIDHPSQSSLPLAPRVLVLGAGSFGGLVVQLLHVHAPNCEVHVCEWSTYDSDSAYREGVKKHVGACDIIVDCTSLNGYVQRGSQLLDICAGLSDDTYRLVVFIPSFQSSIADMVSSHTCPNVSATAVICLHPMWGPIAFARLQTHQRSHLQTIITYFVGSSDMWGWCLRLMDMFSEVEGLPYTTDYTASQHDRIVASSQGLVYVIGQYLDTSGFLKEHGRTFEAFAEYIDKNMSIIQTFVSQDFCINLRNSLSTYLTSHTIRTRKDVHDLFGALDAEYTQGQHPIPVAYYTRIKQGLFLGEGALTLLYQGQQGSFSSYVADDLCTLDTRVHVMGKSSYQDVREAINETTFALLPIENSHVGSIQDTVNFFVQYPYMIRGQIIEQTSHALLATHTDEKLIHTVYSQAEVLAQCRNYCARYNIKQIARSDTAAAAGYVASLQDPGCAAIAPMQAATLHNLHILKQNIQNHATNTTRYVIVAHPDTILPHIFGSPEQSHIAMLVHMSHTPGSLHACLGVFVQNHINLTNIVAVASAADPYSYIFWLEGSMQEATNKDISTLYQQLAPYVQEVRHVGQF